LAAVSSAFAQANSSAPIIFAPGLVSGIANAGSPTFTPRGDTMFFTRTTVGGPSVIMESDRANGAWSAPRTASFSGGEYSESQPALAPDGSFLVYVSVRDHVANLYRVIRDGLGWSAPERLPDAVNIAASVWRPSIAADGSIYFCVITKTEDSRTMRLWRSAFDSGTYQPAAPLPFSLDSMRDVDPEVAPDQSYILFASAGRAAIDDPHEHLYMAVRNGDAWGPVVPIQFPGNEALGVDDNEPRLSPGQRMLYFTSDRSVLVMFPRSGESLDAPVVETTNVWSMPASVPHH
jgi:Tol biopolymer transport system component